MSSKWTRRLPAALIVAGVLIAAGGIMLALQHRSETEEQAATSPAGSAAPDVGIAAPDLAFADGHPAPAKVEPVAIPETTRREAPVEPARPTHCDVRLESQTGRFHSSRTEIQATDSATGKPIAASSALVWDQSNGRWIARATYVLAPDRPGIRIEVSNHDEVAFPWTPYGVTLTREAPAITFTCLDEAGDMEFRFYGYPRRGQPELGPVRAGAFEVFANDGLKQAASFGDGPLTLSVSRAAEATATWIIWSDGFVPACGSLRQALEQHPVDKSVGLSADLQRGWGRFIVCRDTEAAPLANLGVRMDGVDFGRTDSLGSIFLHRETEPELVEVALDLADHWADISYDVRSAEVAAVITVRR